MKTIPKGIRFKPKDLEFVMKRESLSSAQQVVSFLISEYLKLYKIEKKSVFEVGEPNKVDFKKSEIVEPIKQFKSVNQYLAAKRDVENDDDWAAFCETLDEDTNLTSRQRDLIKTTHVW